ncbi:putative Dilute domain-containing protein [Helianthus annuus]|nr:putative Dilute domain-containing protein [Helianthus annuus]
MIVNTNGCILDLLNSNNVPPFLLRKIFTQIFAYINVRLFNSVLLNRECCFVSNGEYVQAGLSKLKQWCYKATEEVNFLCLPY